MSVRGGDEQINIDCLPFMTLKQCSYICNKYSCRCKHTCMYIYIYIVHEIWWNKLDFGGKRYRQFYTLTHTYICHIIKHIYLMCITCLVSWRLRQEQAHSSFDFGSENCREVHSPSHLSNPKERQCLVAHWKDVCTALWTSQLTDSCESLVWLLA